MGQILTKQRYYSSRASFEALQSKISELKSCRTPRDLEKGRRIHAELIETGESPDIYTASSLINMYSKCGSMAEARRVFEGIRRPDTFSWNALISGYSNNGDGDSTLYCFRCMALEGCSPDPLSFLAALKACKTLAENETGEEVSGKVVKVQSLKKIRSLHSQALLSGFDSEMKVSNTLLDLYMSCGSTQEASRFFHSMLHRSVVSWTVMIQGFVSNGEPDRALELFSRMEDCQPDKMTIVAALKACTSLAESKQGWKTSTELLEHGRSIHSRCSGSDIFLANSLIVLYSKCGSISEAVKVHERMPEHDLVSMNSLLLGYADNGYVELALDLFSGMKLRDGRTFVAALKACTRMAERGVGEKIRALENGMRIHSRAVKQGFDGSLFVANSLVDFYSECGAMVDARRVFDTMQARDVVSWTALILGFVKNNEENLALELFHAMESEEGIRPNAATFLAAVRACRALSEEEEAILIGEQQQPVKIKSLERAMELHSRLTSSESKLLAASTSLIDLYSGCGSVGDARRLFDSLPCWSLTMWTALIQGYAEAGLSEEALGLFRIMEVEMQPDAQTFVAALKACTASLSLPSGRELHRRICRLGYAQDAILATCLVDFYGKCGSITGAHQVFDSFENYSSSYSRLSSFLWTSLIAGYSRQGETLMVFRLFSEMLESGVPPSGVTFLCVLSACSHGGLVENGKRVFEAMSSRFGIAPGAEHYACMADLFGRSNQAQAAAGVAELAQNDVVAWTSVLGSSGVDLELGKRVFEGLAGRDDRNAATYELMANIYCSAEKKENSRPVSW